MKFSIFDIIVLESNEIHHFRQIRLHELRWDGYLYVSILSRGQNQYGNRCRTYKLSIICSSDYCYSRIHINRGE